MPKHEIFHKPGNPVSEEIRLIIDKYFDAKQVRRLERLGGRILISIASPYKRRPKKGITINQEFMSILTSKKSDSNALKTLLDELSIKQLKEVSREMGHPMRSNATAEEIKRELIRSIQAEDFWNSISKNHK